MNEDNIIDLNGRPVTDVYRLHACTRKEYEHKAILRYFRQEAKLQR